MPQRFLKDTRATPKVKGDLRQNRQTMTAYTVASAQLIVLGCRSGLHPHKLLQRPSSAESLKPKRHTCHNRPKMHRPSEVPEVHKRSLGSP